MKTLQQEILLMTGTSFTSRQCLQKNDIDNQNLSEPELLQEACCNGLLSQMLPEICENDKKMFVWKINENKSCIEIEIGEFPQIIEENFSIDPYTFMSLQSFS
ncbi:MAG: hypothetical protein M3Z26_02270 [Bacteroidota bacterium]|nr:hypothetical protein [Bacteroidota bacterium]